MSDSPLYVQIKDYIADNIDSGYWSVGEKITTELELTKQFNVSRMTVNKAIRDLVNDGKLVRKPRAGTFVCAPAEKLESPLLDTTNIANEVEQRGHLYHSDVVKHTAIVADNTVATKLGIMLGSNVFYSEIIHFEENVPIQLELRWVNPSFVPDYLKQDFTNVTPHEYLSDTCPLTAIEHTVEAINPDTSIRERLNLSQHEPCLLLNRRTWSQDKLISSALLYHPGSKYKLSSKVSFN
ncbi:histidine utilization repressor [Vibrio sp. S4M6]|uniref:histidine utilization repressor n=1 Tax=Vibrio sinus TaxID=2946865 RepID=UPI00202A1F3B|nr:histidine utilization repressor [Vibrio sinus]MCL9783772.1 histidine utilization repressor [Vibrio sinus]